MRSGHSIVGYGCLCRCSSARGSEMWPAFAAFVFSSVGAVQKKPPVCESRKTAPFPPGVDPAVSAHRPRPLLPPVWGRRRRGTVSAYLRRPALMCRLTADISNVKLWATSDLCGEPPVSSYSSPPRRAGTCSAAGPPEDRQPAQSTRSPPPPRKGHLKGPPAFRLPLSKGMQPHDMIYLFFVAIDDRFMHLHNSTCTGAALCGRQRLH